jgi:ATP-dependent RNA helicase DeaD
VCGPASGERWSSFSVEFAVTRSVRDAAALLDEVAGPQTGDPYFAPPPAAPALDIPTRAERLKEFPEIEMVRYRIEVGSQHGVLPKHIVGAIANEANVNPRGIGDIEIAETFSIVELPERDVDHVIRALRGATLRGRKVKENRDLGFRNNAPRPQQ